MSGWLLVQLLGRFAPNELDSPPLLHIRPVFTSQAAASTSQALLRSNCAASARLDFCVIATTGSTTARALSLKDWHQGAVSKTPDACVASAHVIESTQAHSQVSTRQSH